MGVRVSKVGTSQGKVRIVPSYTDDTASTLSKQHDGNTNICYRPHPVCKVLSSIVVRIKGARAAQDRGVSVYYEGPLLGHFWFRTALNWFFDFLRWESPVEGFAMPGRTFGHRDGRATEIIW